MREFGGDDVLVEAAANFGDREVQVARAPSPPTAKSLMLVRKARTSIFVQAIRAASLSPSTN